LFDWNVTKYSSFMFDFIFLFSQIPTCMQQRFAIFLPMGF
jgi:hypothetical protein